MEKNKKTKKIKINFLLIIIFLIFILAIISSIVYVYIDSRGNYGGAKIELDLDETEKFNINFDIYSGKRLGYEVRDLLTIIKNNATENETEPSKVLTIKYSQLTSEEINATSQIISYEYEENSDNLLDYQNKCIEIIRKLENKHTYGVVFSYDENRMIKAVTIQYDANNFGTEPGEK